MFQADEKGTSERSELNQYIIIYYNMLLFLNTDLDFPCRGNKDFAIEMCDSAVQWEFEKLGTGSDASCVSKVTGTDCGIISGEYKGVCCQAPSATCPNDLKALINASIQFSKSARLRK